MRRLLLALSVVACTGQGDEPTEDSDQDSDRFPVDTDDTDPCDEEAPVGDPPAWRPLAEGLGGALLSVTGTCVNDVWSVGAEDESGPTVLRYDGAAWARIDAPKGGDLWWGWRPPGTTNVLWSVGAEGRALRWDGSSWTGGTIAGAEGLNLFGIWGASEDEVFAVGGDITASADAAVMFRWSGTDWAPVELPEKAAAAAALYKVWGSAADDVWAVGMGGVILHYDGSTWTDVDSPTERLLLTVHGSGPTDVWAVGGIGTATILRYDGATWTDESPDFAPDMNGVYARGEQVIAVGRTGQVWTRSDGVWVMDPRGRVGVRDLHAGWIDNGGGTWAVGGQISAIPLVQGVMFHAGDDAVPEFEP